MMRRPRLRPLLPALLLATAALPALQGCFPIAVGGAGMAVAMAADRRSSGTYVEDEGIEWKANQRISERLGDQVHANVTAFNRNVLLTGEAFDEPSRQEAGRIAAAVENVRGVTNELRLAGNSSLAARASDGYLTSMVKARFVNQKDFRPQHVKVVTEAGTVYLMGLVTRAEADAATHIARNTEGVGKVVRVFEYIPDDEARRLDGAPADAGAKGGGPRAPTAS